MTDALTEEVKQAVNAALEAWYAARPGIVPHARDAFIAELGASAALASLPAPPSTRRRPMRSDALTEEVKQAESNVAKANRIANQIASACREHNGQKLYDARLEMVQLVEALESAALLSRLEGGEREGWRPIESAPHGELVVLAWRDKFLPSWSFEIGLASHGERFANGYSNMSYHGYATHWCPLPAAPVKEPTP